jgi:carbonic anhydrase
VSDTYKVLLEGNRRFVKAKLEADPDFFENLKETQRPTFLWLGCADSRVPADQITGTSPGQIFVTRNIANLAIHTDFSLLSVLDYGVNVLKVHHIIVCGHYGCGGVRAAMSKKQFGLIDNWLRHIKDVYSENRDELDAISDEVQRENRLVELNVVAQAHNVCKTSIVQNAWNKGEFPHVHGWVYDVSDGLIRTLGMDFKAHSDDPGSIYKFLHE